MNPKANLWSVCVAILLAAVVAWPRAVVAQDGSVEADLRYARSVSRAFQHVARKIEPSVVHINAYDRVRVVQRDFFGRALGVQEQLRPTGLGSGVIVSSDGHILTNNHVVGRAQRLLVKLQDGRQLDAEVIGRDPATDLAVLRIDANDLTPAVLGNSDALDVGEWVVAIGSPFGFENSVTAGIVSAKGRRGLSRDSTERYEEFIQTDAAINPGNSGGPLVNLDGEVIGINTQIASTAGGSIGIGFAIPSNMARSVMDMIIQHGRTERGWLGVTMQDITPDLVSSLRLSTRTGVIVREIVENSPAAKAGLRQGDVIVAIDGRPVTDSNRLRNLIAFTSPGERVTLSIFRGGQRMEVTAEILDQTAGRAMEVGGIVLNEIGLVVRTVDAAVARRLGYSADLRGALVIEVIEGSPAEEAGLVVGDIILTASGRTVRTAEDFASAIRTAARRGEPAPMIALEFARAGRRWATEITPK